MRVALDTNILAYAEGIGDNARQQASFDLVRNLPPSLVVIPVQCLGELFRVLTGKARQDATSAQQAVLGWADVYETADSTWTAFQSAMDVVTSHNLQIWDALILAVAAEQRCRLLLSEDMRHEFTWHGVTVINPYQTPKHHLLQDMLTGNGKRGHKKGVMRVRIFPSSKG
jgi:predicted nucleic acid-binding protein